MAATLDLTGGVFSVVTSGAAPDKPVSLSETADGVTLIITALDSLVGADRLFTSPDGLELGGGGGSTVQFSLVADTAISLTGFSSTASASSALSDSVFHVSDGSGAISIGNPLDGLAAVFASGPLALGLGDTFVFSVTNPSSLTRSDLAMLQFETAATPTPVPLPAPASMLLAALAAMFWRTRSTA